MCDKEDRIHGSEKCQVDFETIYATDKPELIYYEKCYQQGIY